MKSSRPATYYSSAHAGRFALRYVGRDMHQRLLRDVYRSRDKLICVLARSPNVSERVRGYSARCAADRVFIRFVFVIVETRA
jgi:hypothetical protein